MHVFTDASGKKGLGGVFGMEWFSSCVPWRFCKHDIQFKELYVVLQAILRWGHKWVDKHVVFHIDNQVDIWALENDTNRSPHIMTVLHMVVMLAVQLNYLILLPDYLLLQMCLLTVLLVTCTLHCFRWLHT